MTTNTASDGNLTSVLYAIALLVLVAMQTSGAQAADTGGRQARDGIDERSQRIDEIIVTARRRSENLQEIGIAITAIDGDTLEKLRSDDARDLVRQAPSLQMQTSFGMSNPAVFLRGVGVNDVSAIASSSVAFYLDGAYIASPAGQLFQFFDMERVEVLRGPQGTLYGRNTPAGAINFLSRDPDRQFDASARASFGRFNEFSLKGAIGGPLSESIATRFAFVSNQRDGHVDNLTLGTSDSDIDNWGARASFLFEPGQSFEGIIRIQAGRSNAGSKRNKSQGLLDPDAVAGGIPLPCDTPEQLGTCSDPLGYVDTDNPYAGNWNLNGDEEVEYTVASATLIWHLSGLTLVSVSAYNDDGRNVAHDADGSPNQLLEIDWQDDSRQWSQEFRLMSSGQSGLNWIAGLYFFDREVEMAQTNDAFRELRPLLGFNPAQGVFTVKTDFDADVSAAAAFGEIDFRVAENTRAFAGLRYTSEDHRIDRFDRIEEPGFVIELVDLVDNVDFSDVSGRIGIEHTTAPGNLLHFGISKGYKSGGFNGSVAIDPDAIPPFDEETVISYEAGFKWTSPNGWFRLNSAAFYYDYRDLQVFTRVNTGGIPREILTNAADAKILGAEFELQINTQSGWSGQFAIGLLDTELENFRTFAGTDFSGNDLVYAPSTTVSGLIQRDWPAFDGRMIFQLDFHYQDKVYFETSNNPLLSEDAYSLWNARLAFRTGDERREFAVWGQNLSDTEYKVATVELADFGFNNVTFAEPRTWGVEVAWRY